MVTVGAVGSDEAPAKLSKLPDDASCDEDEDVGSAASGGGGGGGASGASCLLLCPLNDLFELTDMFACDGLIDCGEDFGSAS